MDNHLPSDIATQDKLLRGLNIIELEITPVCNLYCVHCYAESSPLRRGDKSDIDWLQVLADARRLGATAVQFIGGEPLLNRSLLSLISQASSLGYGYIEVFSNLTTLTDNAVSHFQRYGVRVATSFYSRDEKIHEGITRMKGSYRKTIDGITKILNAGLPLRASIVKTEANRNDIENSVTFLRSMGVQEVRAGEVIAAGRGSTLSLNKDLMAGLKGCGACWMGSLVVSWDGNVYPCLLSRSVLLGNIKSGSLNDILNAERLQQFRKEIYATWLEKSLQSQGRKCGPDVGGCNPWDEPGCQPNCGVRVSSAALKEIGP